MGPTHSHGIWGLVGRIPKGFLIWTRFKGCTWPSKIRPTSSKKTKIAAVAEWQWREVSLTFNIDIVSFRPHHLFAWWWGALPPGYLDLYLVQYSHDVIISLFHRKASGRPYLFHFEKAARFAFSLTTSFVFTYCSSISHIAGCWSVASSKAQVVCLRGQSSWWQRGNWGKVKKCSSCRLHRRHPGQAQALQNLCQLLPSET